MVAHSVHQEFSAGSSLPVSANFEPNSSGGKNSVDGAPLDRPEIYAVCHIKTRSLKGVQKIWHMLFGGCYDRPLCNVQILLGIKFY